MLSETSKSSRSWVKAASSHHLQHDYRQWACKWHSFSVKHTTLALSVPPQTMLPICAQMDIWMCQACDHLIWSGEKGVSVETESSASVSIHQSAVSTDIIVRSNGGPGRVRRPPAVCLLANRCRRKLNSSYMFSQCLLHATPRSRVSILARQFGTGRRRVPIRVSSSSPKGAGTFELPLSEAVVALLATVCKLQSAKRAATLASKVQLQLSVKVLFSVAHFFCLTYIS